MKRVVKVVRTNSVYVFVDTETEDAAKSLAEEMSNVDYKELFSVHMTFDNEKYYVMTPLDYELKHKHFTTQEEFDKDIGD